MFKNLVDFWRGKDFMTSVLEEFEKMLDNAKEMFDLVCKRLIYNEDVKDLEDRVYSIDRNINELEREILLSCIDVISFQEIKELLPHIPDDQLISILNTLKNKGIVFEEDNHYLALPLRYAVIQIYGNIKIHLI